MAAVRLSSSGAPRLGPAQAVRPRAPQPQRCAARRGVPMRQTIPQPLPACAGPHQGTGRSRQWTCRAAEGGGIGVNVDSLEQMDSNQLQTLMVMSLKNEDYALAARVRDELRARGANDEKTEGYWEGLGAPAWLADRLVRLGFPMPLEVQKMSMGKILRDGKDALIVSQTGSGKTLSYLVPLLCSLDYEYFMDYYVNQMVDVQDDLRKIEADAEGVIDVGGESAQTTKQPPVQAVIVVPAFELGAQVCLMAFRLLGGHMGPRRPGDSSNLFSYTGPKGVEITGLFTEKDVLRATMFGALEGIQILVATPNELLECSRQGGLDMKQLKFFAVDEFDEILQEHPHAVSELLESVSDSARVVLCGATISEEETAEVIKNGWVESDGDLRLNSSKHVPSGTNHRYVLVAREDRKLLAVARLLRQDLRDLGEDAPPARVMMYAQSDETARKAAPALRRSLWGQHKMTALLPEGKEPLLALQAFRDNQTTMLLCTPSHCRGLDLPAVSHVYNLEVPETTAAYVHQAGRTGRVGMVGDGLVTTVVTEAELPILMKMSQELGLEMERVEMPEMDMKQILKLEFGEEELGDDVASGYDTQVAEALLPEDVIRNLDDMYNLFSIDDPQGPLSEAEEEEYDTDDDDVNDFDADSDEDGGGRKM